ncbi:MAG: hypothetical protein V9E96_08560 [Chitinophagaceae bacterium]
MRVALAAAAIANFLPQLDFVDMDGPLLLTKDLATGLTISSSGCALAGSKGLGITPQLHIKYCIPFPVLGFNFFH